jgi:hypothetical protein
MGSNPIKYSIQGSELLWDIQPLTVMVLDKELCVSMKFIIVYSTAWSKMIVSPIEKLDELSVILWNRDSISVVEFTARHQTSC